MSEEDDVPALVDSSGEDDDSDMSEHDYPGLCVSFFELRQDGQKPMHTEGVIV